MDLFTLGLVLGLLALMRGGGGGKSPPAAKPTSLVPPKKKPELGGPAKPLAPSPQEPEGAPVEVSQDCKSVTLSPEGVALISELAAELAAKGYGLDPYPVELAKRGMDATVRTIAEEATEDSPCVEDAPWLDRYAAQNPPPRPQQEQTREEYQDAMDAWNDGWRSMFSGWAQSYPEMYELFRGIGAQVYAARNGELGVDASPGAQGPNPKGATNQEAGTLRALGYDLDDPEAIRNFQDDYNAVRDYMTRGEWSARDLDILEDNIIGPQTRSALDWVASNYPDAARWRSAVLTASIEGF